jgi:hypothetical protein
MSKAAGDARVGEAAANGEKLDNVRPAHTMHLRCCFHRSPLQY